MRLAPVPIRYMDRFPDEIAHAETVASLKNALRAVWKSVQDLQPARCH